MGIMFLHFACDESDFRGKIFCFEIAAKVYNVNANCKDRVLNQEPDRTPKQLYKTGEHGHLSSDTSMPLPVLLYNLILSLITMIFFQAIT